MTTPLSFITPDWPAPPQVRCAVTTRSGGYSKSVWSHFNLAQHVDDDPDTVLANRRLLRDALQLPDEPRWLQQVHGIEVLPAEYCLRAPIADGSWTRQPGCVLAVLTADCLPVVFCNKAGTVIAVAHAGWRGLAAGVLAEALKACGEPVENMLVWLGPAIGPQAFEVGMDVYNTVALAAVPGWKSAFVPVQDSSTQWLLDLYHLARVYLAVSGVTAVYGGGLCTFTDSDRFYSYRRDGATGRMATLLWLDR